MRIGFAHLHARIDTMEKRLSRKKAVNLSIDAGLAAEAKEAGINLSALLESGLEAALHVRRLEIWREQNREAVDAYNKFIEQHGLLSDEWRGF